MGIPVVVAGTVVTSVVVLGNCNEFSGNDQYNDDL